MVGKPLLVLGVLVSAVGAGTGGYYGYKNFFSKEENTNEGQGQTTAGSVTTTPAVPSQPSGTTVGSQVQFSAPAAGGTSPGTSSEAGKPGNSGNQSTGGSVSNSSQDGSAPGGGTPGQAPSSTGTTGTSSSGAGGAGQGTQDAPSGSSGGASTGTGVGS